jgi:hypothetical protein
MESNRYHRTIRQIEDERERELGTHNRTQQPSESMDKNSNLIKILKDKYEENLSVIERMHKEKIEMERKMKLMENHVREKDSSNDHFITGQSLDEERYDSKNTFNGLTPEQAAMNIFADEGANILPEEEVVKKPKAKNSLLSKSLTLDAHKKTSGEKEAFIWFIRS